MIWLWILLAVAAVLLAALLGAARYLFRFSIVRGEEPAPEEGSPTWDPFREKMQRAQGWLKEHTKEHVTVRSFDGLKLSALYIPAETETPKGTCIVFHGYRSLATVDFAPEAEFLHSLGYRLLMPYQRSHGESEGEYIAYGVKERFDCRDWARYAEERFGGGDIFLMGISMGAATVMMASGLDLPESVRGIVADCGYTSPWDIMAHVAKRDFKLPAFPLLHLVDLIARRRAGFSLKEADSREALAKTGLPVLFIHGEEDDFVPLSMTEENYRACRSEKELYTVPGAGHAQSFSTDPAGCGERIAAFMEREASAPGAN